MSLLTPAWNLTERGRVADAFGQPHVLRLKSPLQGQLATSIKRTPLHSFSMRAKLQHTLHGRLMPVHGLRIHSIGTRLGGSLSPTLYRNFLDRLFEK